MPEPRTRNAQEWVEKTQRRAAQAGQDYQAGVNRVTSSPTAAAADNVQGYINGVTEAVQNGKFEAGLRRVSLEDWKRQTIQKGVNRYTQGVQQATANMQRGANILLQAIREAQGAIADMPRDTQEGRIARSAAYQRAMSAAIARLKGQS